MLAQPFITMRNDHQDALSAGLAVGELAPGSKSADEIRALWQWVEARLKVRATVSKQPVSEPPTSPRAHNAMFQEASADEATLVSWSGL